MTHHRYTEAELALPEHGAWVRRGHVLVFEADETWDRNETTRTGRTHRPKPVLTDPKPETCGEKVGTAGGSRLHYRATERPCEECRLGSNAAQAVGRKSRKITVGKSCVCGKAIAVKSTWCRVCACAVRNGVKSDDRIEGAKTVGNAGITANREIIEERPDRDEATSQPGLIHPSDISRQRTEMHPIEPSIALAVESRVA